MSTATQAPAKERLLAAGATLFAERGYDGVSVREICRNASTSVNMVHHYFGSKEGLLNAILAQYSAGVFDVPTRILEKVPASKEDFVILFELLFETTFEAYVQHRAGLMVALRVQAPLPALERFSEVFTAFIARGKKMGVVRASLDASMITGAILDRLINQVAFAPFIKSSTGVDVLTDVAYQRQWCRENAKLFLYGVVAST